MSNIESLLYISEVLGAPPLGIDVGTTLADSGNTSDSVWMNLRTCQFCHIVCIERIDIRERPGGEGQLKSDSPPRQSIEIVDILYGNGSGLTVNVGWQSDSADRQNNPQETSTNRLSVSWVFHC